ncbi:MAG TPA: hypothetical protein VNA21_11385 [Steroidobacteraceae bacterium]|nr:hypothetical protein [Steroidobacteraceae bacterium]
MKITSKARALAFDKASMPSTLDCDEEAGGYVVSLSRDELESAPAYSMEELTQGDGTQFRERVYDFYKAPRYW